MRHHRDTHSQVTGEGQILSGGTDRQIRTDVRCKRDPQAGSGGRETDRQGGRQGAEQISRGGR